MIKENAKKILHPKRLKKFIDWLAYGSLILDICITIITLSSIFYPTDVQKYLGTVNITLSVVVVLSIASAVMIVGIRVYEELFFRTYGLRTRIENHVNRLRRFDWIRHKMFDKYAWQKRFRKFFGRFYSLKHLK
jgi:membrane protease YdiL (CAAX protease family)